MRTLFSQVLSVSVVCALSSSCGDETRPSEPKQSTTKSLTTVGDNDNDSGSGDDDDSGDDGLKTIDFKMPDESGSDDGGDEATESQCKHIDFMFIIDDSRSMADEQENLRRSVPQFIDAIKGDLDLETFQVGVISSDQYALNVAPCAELGGFVINSTEGMCGPFAEGNNFMTQEDDLDEAFVCAAALGVEGESDEKPMEAMTNGLSGDLECNEGFIREEALLVVTVITDEEDDHVEPSGNVGSIGDPEDWYKAVIDAKEGIEENAVALALVGIPKPNECPPFQWDGFTGAEINRRIREFVEMFGERGFIGDVCADNYGPFFEQVIDVVEQACEDFIPP